MTEKCLRDGSPGRHDTLRDVTVKRFRPEAVNRFRATTESQLAALTRPIAARSGPFDLADLAYSLSFRVICIVTGLAAIESWQRPGPLSRDRLPLVPG